MKGQEAIFFSFEIEFRILSESKDSNISAPGVEALEGRKSLPCDLLLSLSNINRIETVFPAHAPISRVCVCLLSRSSWKVEPRVA